VRRRTTCRQPTSRTRSLSAYLHPPPLPTHRCHLASPTPAPRGGDPDVLDMAPEEPVRGLCRQVGDFRGCGQCLCPSLARLCMALANTRDGLSCEPVSLCRWFLGLLTVLCLLLARVDGAFVAANVRLSTRCTWFPRGHLSVACRWCEVVAGQESLLFPAPSSFNPRPSAPCSSTPSSSAPETLSFPSLFS
jgi:hypothetical protein